MVKIFEQFFDQDVLAQFNSEIRKRRNQISFDELSSVFLLIFIVYQFQSVFLS